jgi:SAM-dependent methyltransferase
MTMTTPARSGYDSPGAWADGPAPFYDRIAAWLVALSPVPLAGRRLLDLGAGTGAASRAAAAAGAVPVASDLSLPMLAHDRAARPPAVCADAVALPFGAGRFDAVAAAFSLTHVTAVEQALAECARVLAPGGVLLASSFTRRHEHPAKDLVEDVLRADGWSPPEWYVALKESAEGRLADPLAVLDLGEGAGFASVRVAVEKVPTGIDTPEGLVRWRFGMPSCAGHLATATPARRADLFAAAVEAVTPVARPLRPEVVALVAIR